MLPPTTSRGRCADGYRQPLIAAAIRSTRNRAESSDAHPGLLFTMMANARGRPSVEPVTPDSASVSLRVPVLAMMRPAAHDVWRDLKRDSKVPETPDTGKAE